MKIDRRIARRAIGAVFLLASASVTAQVAPTTSNPAAAGTTDEQKAIELSPFVVKDDQDVGYTATNTLAGMRLSTSLKDTAASVSVLTAQFLSDIGANNLEQAMVWSTNSQIDEQDASGFASSTRDDNSTFYHYGNFRVRGLPATGTRNYFRWRLPSDVFNIERVEEARGPNSVLFGVGSAGGVVNTMSKRALFGRTLREATFQVGSYNAARGTVDINEHFGNKLALRFNGVYGYSEGFREHVHSQNRSGALAATYQVLPKTRIRGEFETGIHEGVVASRDTVTDQFSNWATRGRQLVTGPLTAAQLTAAGVSSLGTATAIYYISNTNSLMNMANTFRTSGSDNLVVGIDPSLGNYTVNTGGPGALRRGHYETASLFVEQQIGKNTFVELAYNKQRDFSRAYQPAGDSRRLYADPNQFLPDGRPNPNAGRYMLEGLSWTWDIARRSENMRLSIAHELNLGKWGNYRFAAMGEREKRNDTDGAFHEAWEGAPFNSDPAAAANQVRRRTYVTPGDWRSYYRSMPKQGLIRGLTDPITGRTLNSGMFPARNGGMRDSPEKQDTRLLAAQARYFKDRIVFGAGFRWDDLDILNHGSRQNPVTRFWEVDYDTKTRQELSGNTRTLGVAGHVTKNISLYYNQSDNFNLPGNVRILPDSQRVGNAEATGKDMGIAFDLLGGRLYARVSYFEVEMVNGANSNYGGTLTNPTSISNIILNALVEQGSLTTAQAAARRTDTNGSTFNRLVEGYELNLTANLTRNWRLQANYSYTDGYVSNIAPEVKAWIEDYIPYYRTFPQNIVTGQQALTIGQVIDEFFIYHNAQLEQEGLILPGNRKHKANLATTYSFSEGRLKGLQIGGGYRWQSKLPVGVPAPRTIRYSNDFFSDYVMIGYRFANTRIPFLKRLNLQLNVTNVTNNQEHGITRYGSDNPANPNYNLIRRVQIKEPRAWQLRGSFGF